jgi:predicted ATPase/DNA-binding winged helix-turn-helix (wHTH) protein
VDLSAEQGAAIDMLAASVQPIFASGACEIDLTRRELRIGGSPIPIGGRAFEFIEVLVQSAGELVTKDELMKRLWPGAVVMENTLQVHAAAVRKALGEYRGLLKTESGRGYRLLGDWAVRHRDAAKPPVGLRQLSATDALPRTNLPAAITQLIGRSAAQQTLQDLVSAYRVVTVTGPGGIGKTALALEVARALLAEFDDGGWLVELASLSDPALVPSAVAGALRLRLGADTISPEAVARAIAEKKLLLVLDNCEHVIDAAATLAGTLIRSCPRATILATSREVFRIGGEYAYRVAPLEVPIGEQVDADQILSHSAPALFVARAKELGADFSLHAESLPTIAAICRDLDGIPLAIEFASARAATLGIEQVASGLSDRFALLTSGRRMTLPRHRTLRATLDWSYNLLSHPERLLLQRLAIFAGSFSLQAAYAVANSGEASEAEIADHIANLLAKSLVTSDFAEGGGYFRLLETTRVYALSKLIESGELQEFSRRHAEYYQGLLERTEAEWEQRSTFSAHVDNVRAALEWCFGASGNLLVGVGLAAAAAPMFLRISLLPECYRWSKQAISALDDATRGAGEEMHLQASLGASSMHMYGQSGSARAAFERSLAIAEARGDLLYQVQLVSTLTMFHTRAGNFKTALHYAKLGEALARTVADATAIALAHSGLGRSLHVMGDHSGARAALEASLLYWSNLSDESDIYLGFDHHILASIGLARTLWLQGHPAQAIERMRQTIRDVERRDNPVFSLGYALFWAPGIFLWVGDLQSAEEYADRLISQGETNFRRHDVGVGRGYKGVLALLRGDARGGVESLKGCLEQLHAVHYEMLNTEFKLALVEGLRAMGQSGDAITLIDETISLIEQNEDLLYMPEALRVKGNVLLSLPERRVGDAERCFTQSLDWSRRQGARAWELRTATDLAALWAAQGQWPRARAILQPIFEQFIEGMDTADLKGAEHLLVTLQ